MAGVLLPEARCQADGLTILLAPPRARGAMQVAEDWRIGEAMSGESGEQSQPATRDSAGASLERRVIGGGMDSMIATPTSILLPRQDGRTLRRESEVKPVVESGYKGAEGRLMSTAGTGRSQPTRSRLLSPSAPWAGWKSPERMASPTRNSLPIQPGSPAVVGSPWILLGETPAKSMASEKEEVAEEQKQASSVMTEVPTAELGSMSGETAQNAVGVGRRASFQAPSPNRTEEEKAWAALLPATPGTAPCDHAVAGPVVLSKAETSATKQEKSMAARHHGHDSPTTTFLPTSVFWKTTFNTYRKESLPTQHDFAEVCKQDKSATTRHSRSCSSSQLDVRMLDEADCESQPTPQFSYQRVETGPRGPIGSRSSSLTLAESRSGGEITWFSAGMESVDTPQSASAICRRPSSGQTPRFADVLDETGDGLQCSAWMMMQPRSPQAVAQSVEAMMATKNALEREWEREETKLNAGTKGETNPEDKSSSLSELAEAAASRFVTVLLDLTNNPESGSAQAPSPEAVLPIPVEEDSPQDHDRPKDLQLDPTFYQSYDKFWYHLYCCVHTGLRSDLQNDPAHTPEMSSFIHALGICERLCLWEELEEHMTSKEFLTGILVWRELAYSVNQALLIYSVAMDRCERADFKATRLAEMASKLDEIRLELAVEMVPGCKSRFSMVTFVDALRLSSSKQCDEGRGVVPECKTSNVSTSSAQSLDNVSTHSRPFSADALETVTPLPAKVDSSLFSVLQKDREIKASLRRRARLRATDYISELVLERHSCWIRHSDELTLRSVGDEADDDHEQIRSRRSPPRDMRYHFRCLQALTMDSTLSKWVVQSLPVIQIQTPSSLASCNDSHEAREAPFFPTTDERADPSSFAPLRVLT